jgi:hypothetical protein
MTPQQSRLFQGFFGFLEGLIAAPRNQTAAGTSEEMVRGLSAASWPAKRLELD